MKNIAVYCGSRTGNKPIYTKSATELGQWFVNNNLGLVYGGASIGIMGTLADTVLSGGGKVTGVMPDILIKKEIAHSQLTKLIPVDDMHVRKKTMMDISEGFIAMPGGCGTLEEIIEVITWSQIGQHQKPFVFYDVDGYYRHLADLFNHMETEGFMQPEQRNKIFFAKNIKEIENHLLLK